MLVAAFAEKAKDVGGVVRDILKENQVGLYTLENLQDLITEIRKTAKIQPRLKTAEE